MKSFRKLKDANGEGRVLNLLGIVSYRQKDYKSVLNYFFQYNQLATKARDENEISSSFNNIGSSYQELGKIDSAIYYYKRTLAYQTAKGSKNNLGMIYQNIGSLYNKLNKFKDALSNHQESMKAFQVAGDRKYLSHSYFNIGLSYKQLKDTTTAIKWFNMAVKLAAEVKESEILKNSYEQLSGLQAAERDYKGAYENLVSAAEMNDSILNLDKTKIIEQLKAQYETEKKELQITELNQQSQIQQLEITAEKHFSYSVNYNGCTYYFCGIFTF